jgi:hypothetical protein
MIRSPLGNLLLYGQTADAGAARGSGVELAPQHTALGTRSPGGGVHLDAFHR